MTTNVHNLELFKYPSTQHLEGSRLQPGDEASFTQRGRTGTHAPYAALAGRHIVVEEKLDGANAGVSFSNGGELLLQSRGHYLAGGGRERQFSIFKRWSGVHEDALLECLGDRYVMYGEWMAKKHSVFYNRLPHFFCEFDIHDRSTGTFLSTQARAALLAGAPVLPVPVLYAGTAPRHLRDLLALLRPSLARTPQWREDFETTVRREGHDLSKCWAQADKSDLAEGLYVKVEEEGVVQARYKWVRQDFVQTILDTNLHHSKMPFIPNALAAGADIYAPSLRMGWETMGEPR